VQDVNERGRKQFVIFTEKKKNFLIRKSKFFSAKKHFSSRQKWRFPPF